MFCVVKEHYFNQLSVVLDPNSPRFKETQWIMSEDVKIEHLLNVFATVNANPSDVWDTCTNFMIYPFWHKPQLTILGPKIEKLPDTNPYKSQYLFQLSWLFGSVGNNVGCK